MNREEEKEKGKGKKKYEVPEQLTNSGGIKISVTINNNNHINKN